MSLFGIGRRYYRPLRRRKSNQQIYFNVRHLIGKVYGRKYGFQYWRNVNRNYRRAFK